MLSQGLKYINVNSILTYPQLNSKCRLSVIVYDGMVV